LYKEPQRRKPWCLAPRIVPADEDTLPKERCSYSPVLKKVADFSGWIQECVNSSRTEKDSSRSIVIVKGVYHANSSRKNIPRRISLFSKRVNEARLEFH